MRVAEDAALDDNELQDENELNIICPDLLRVFHLLQLQSQRPPGMTLFMIVKNYFTILPVAIPICDKCIFSFRTQYHQSMGS